MFYKSLSASRFPKGTKSISGWVEMAFAAGNITSKNHFSSQEN